jgi:hypothetical protein
MKKVLLTLLAVVFVLGLLGAAGFTGYRYGYNQGILASTDGDTPFLGPRGFEFGLRSMPMHDFGFMRGFGRDEFGMMPRGFGFDFFSPLAFLLKLLFWGLVIWSVYMLITRSGWRLTRTTPVSETPPPPHTNVENRE